MVLVWWCVSSLFQTDFDKSKFFANLYKLKEAAARLRAVSVQHDLSPEERIQSQNLYNEAEKKNADESPSDFLYKVRGPPGAMRVVKVYNRR